MNEQPPPLGTFLAKADKFFDMPPRKGNELRRFAQEVIGMGHIGALEFEADYMDEYFTERKYYRG